METIGLSTGKTAGILKSEIIMMQANFKGIQFLVEGADDSKFWKPRLRDGEVAIVICEGKKNLVDTAGLIVTFGIKKVVGIYDRDFDGISGITHHPQVLAVTDENDLEITMIRSGALQTLLMEYAEPDQVRLFESARSIRVVNHVEKLTKEFGCLRYVNHVERHGVNFDDLSIYRFISSTEWDINASELYAEYARLAAITTSDLNALVAKHCVLTDPWIYCQGHDAASILAQGFKRVINNKQFKGEDIERILRLAFTESMLRDSSMYAALCVINAMHASRLFCWN